MNRFFSLALLCAAVAMATTGAIAQELTLPTSGYSNSYENSIQVTGKSEREVPPDETYVRIVINEKQLKDKKSVEQAEQDMIRALSGIGIDTEKHLKIDQMSSGYKTYSLKTGRALTSVEYELMVGSAAQLGQVYQALEAEGISGMNVVRQTHSRIREIEREMRVEAIQNARQTAEELTAAIGQKIGLAVFISDNATANDARIGFALHGLVPGIKSRGVADVYDTPLEFRDMALSYGLTVKFALDGRAK